MNLKNITRINRRLNNRTMLKNYYIRIILTALFIIFFLIFPSESQITEDSQENLPTDKKVIKEQETFMKGLQHYVNHDYYMAATIWQEVLDLNPEHEKAKVYMEKAFAEYFEQEKYL